MVSDWTSSVSSGVRDALRSLVGFVPNVIGALIVLVIGVIVGYVLKEVVVRILRAIKLRPTADKVGWTKVFPGRYDVVELLGDFVKWFFIIVFLLQALTIVRILTVTDLVSRLLAYLPHVLAAAVVVVVGAVVADLVSRVVLEASRAVGSNAARLGAGVSRLAVWVVVFFTVLAELGVNTLFLDRLFTAIVAMVAIAGGLAFGLGGRDAAHDALEEVRKTFKA